VYNNTNTSLTGVEIGTFDQPLFLEKIGQYGSTISIEQMDINPFIYYIKGPIFTVIRIIIIIILVGFIGYGIYNLIQIFRIYTSESIIIKLIIIFAGEYAIISTLLFYIIDPFHVNGTVTETVFTLMEVNPSLVMFIQTILISIVWHKMMINDFNLNKEQWVNNILFIILFITLILYPVIMVFVYIENSIILALFYAVVVLFVIIIIGILVYYLVNLVRVINRIRKKDFKSSVTFRHLDKIIVVVVYVLLFIFLIIGSLYETVVSILVFENLLLMLSPVNCLMFFFFVRISKKDTRTLSTSKGSRKFSSNS